MDNKISNREKKKYVLKEERDFQILDQIHGLEKCELSLEDAKTIKLIRTQLEDDWRKPLIKFMDEMNKKYKK
jgi:hypothetical protein